MIDSIEIKDILCFKGTYTLKFNIESRCITVLGRTAGGKSALLKVFSYILGDIDLVDLTEESYASIKFTDDDTLFLRSYPVMFSIAGKRSTRDEYIQHIQMKANILDLNKGLHILARFKDELSIRSYIDDYLIKTGYHDNNFYPIYHRTIDNESSAFEETRNSLQTLTQTMEVAKKERRRVLRSITMLRRRHALVQTMSKDKKNKKNIPLMMKHIFNLSLEEHKGLLNKSDENFEAYDRSLNEFYKFNEESNDRKSLLSERLDYNREILEDSINNEFSFVMDARKDVYQINFGKPRELEIDENPTQITPNAAKYDIVFDGKNHRKQMKQKLAVYSEILAHKQKAFRESMKQMESSISSLSSEIHSRYTTLTAKRESHQSMDEKLDGLRLDLTHYKKSIHPVRVPHSCHAEDIVDEFRKMDAYCEGLVTDLLVVAPSYESIVYTVLREHEETPIIFTHHKMIQFCCRMFRNSPHCNTNLTIICSTLMPVVHDKEIPQDIVKEFPGVRWVSSMVKSNTEILTVAVKNSVKEYYYLADEKKAHELAKRTELPVIDKHKNIHRVSTNFIIAPPKIKNNVTIPELHTLEDKIRAERVRISMVKNEIEFIESDIEFLRECSGNVLNAMKSLNESYSEWVAEYHTAISSPRESFSRMPHSLSQGLCQLTLQDMENSHQIPTIRVDLTIPRENYEREIIESIIVHDLETQLELDEIDRAFYERDSYCLGLEETAGLMTELVDASTANLIYQWQNFSVEDRDDCIKSEQNHDEFDHFRPFVEIVLNDLPNLYYMKIKLREAEEAKAKASTIRAEQDAIFLESSRRRMQARLMEKKKVNAEIRSITKRIKYASLTMKNIKRSKLQRCETILKNVIPLFKVTYRELNRRFVIDGDISTVDASIYDHEDQVGITLKVSSNKGILLPITTISYGEFKLVVAALNLALAMLCKNTILLMDEFESDLDHGTTENFIAYLKNVMSNPVYNCWLISVTETNYSNIDQLVGLEKNDSVKLFMKSFT